VSYLRFTPDEYHVVVCLWEGLGLGHEPPQAAKRLLIEASAEDFPALAMRLAGLSPKQLRLMWRHLRGPEPLKHGHGLTAEELRLLTNVAGGLLSQVRFVQAMQGFLVEHFQERHPALAEKLHRMTLRQFELLCRVVG
jgi:hypothetical protein